MLVRRSCHEAAAAESLNIIDRISCQGLVPVEGYAVNGTLMDRETGKSVTASATLKQEKAGYLAILSQRSMASTLAWASAST